MALSYYEKRGDCLLAALLTVPLALSVQDHGGGVGTAEADPVPSVVALELADVRLAAQNLAASHARPRALGPRPLLPGKTLLLELLIDLGAGAGDDASEEVGADESRVPLPGIGKDVGVFGEVEEVSEVPDGGVGVVDGDRGVAVHRRRWEVEGRRRRRK
ncbi:hypothetical protein CRG98_010879 [Punica granatum]|uniref:Uncharacterized protein n=1 Tax=Punica granatum TaxID=22663 RepID=A0A2I0KJY3_PUNGR|nr:hypothetical protein CRG98_010879 [Punica granatum]